MLSLRRLEISWRGQRGTEVCESGGQRSGLVWRGAARERDKRGYLKSWDWMGKRRAGVGQFVVHSSAGGHSEECGRDLRRKGIGGNQHRMAMRAS